MIGNTLLAGLQRQPWFRRTASWYHLAKLRREIRQSESFQKECEKLQYFNLAELEARHRKGLLGRIKELQQMQ